MDNDNEMRQRGDDLPDGQQGDGEVEDPSGATLIGANVVGLNTTPYPGAVAAPAAEAAAKEAEEEEGSLAPLNLDALEPFANRQSTTGDDRVSQGQGELESDELNG